MSTRLLLAHRAVRLPRPATESAAALRTYTAASNDKSVDAESEMPLGSVGAGSAAESSDNALQERSERSMALVPLSVIYLPPPPWHTPLSAHSRHVSPDAASLDSSHIAADSISRVSSSAENKARHGDAQSASTTDSQNTQKHGRWLLFRSVQQLFSNLLTTTSATKDLVSRTLDSSRTRLHSIRMVPRDDWVKRLSDELNQITGYDRITSLKQNVEETSVQFNQARRDLESVKAKHTQAIQGRITSQREINSLLQRKHLWNEQDVAKFTSLYRTEYQSESAEQTLASQVREAESLADKKYDDLVNSIRMRYHEEQIWSDKIRRASTYGTWAVLVMNILALFMAQAIFEPRKRQRIVDGVDERLTLALDDRQNGLGDDYRALEMRLAGYEKESHDIADRLSVITALLGTVAARQEADVSVQSAQLLGDAGYSDTELDAYYEQQQQQQEQRSIEEPKSVAEEKVYTRTQAQKMAASAAAATSFVIGMVTYYLLA
ncbi:sensitivity to high expression protein she9 [Coemansia sp. RSA 1200]|nr:sensitivity to high expression protein she9 [Coemansia sp. RSA 1200]